MDDLVLTYKDIKLIIKKEILFELSQYRQITLHKNESGGMLIGSKLLYDDTIEINDITQPLIEDSFSPTTFKRSDLHNGILKEKWKKSNHTKMYLGEWHTHPQNIPFPSTVDRSNWIKLLQESKTESEILIFIIIGIKNNALFIGEKYSKDINLIELREVYECENFR
ncbi:Mov34/MPN/PAD-1 family protein [Inconstantimicrobium mannanitabidum]|uniref:Peptidase n=1 Tax=Inconstantimicrobium mannanitabidum TaxID=1604901 RepID=A0ACB5RCC5_9CLOT|nr:Mov34/MPN/PAD-1 family protein [Clostridium sp. TW13]GKX66893.1 peptidase [Clostridium sp. TW13]